MTWRRREFWGLGSPFSQISGKPEGRSTARAQAHIDLSHTSFFLFGVLLTEAKGQEVPRCFSEEKIAFKCRKRAEKGLEVAASVTRATRVSHHFRPRACSALGEIFTR